MEEKTLLIISLICIIVGLPLLFISSKYINSQENPRILNKISGEVVKVMNKEKITIVDFKIDGTIPVVFFDKSNLVQGDSVTITGKLENYKGKIEFVGDKIIP